MISLLIFSKDRACQLDLLIRSILRFAPGLFSHIRVLFEASNEDFMTGYYRVQSMYPGLLFSLEKDFEQDTKSLIGDSERLICFAVDDIFFYREVQLTFQDIRTLFDYPQLGSFSFRLGMNTVWQDWYNKVPIQFPKEAVSVDLTESVFLWEWAKCNTYSDFGYVFSVDLHIYRQEDVLKGLNYRFDTPNAFEARYSTQLPPLMGCPLTSCAVNSPINLVGSSNNIAGRFHPWSLQDLNREYLQGKSISLDRLISNEITAAHQELEITLE